MQPYIEYWEGILKCLPKPTPQQNLILLEDFWLISNWKTNHVRFSLPTPLVLDDIEDPIVLPYCGPKNMKLSLNIVAYTPFRDLLQGDFIFARPYELEVYPIWMGRTHIKVVKDGNDEHYPMVHI